MNIPIAFMYFFNKQRTKLANDDKNNNPTEQWNSVQGISTSAESKEERSKKQKQPVEFILNI
jgi:hypothetical protein